MDLVLPISGAIVAAALMIALATKWKLPRRVSWTGIAVLAIVTALPFVWLYPLAVTPLGTAVLVLCQALAALTLGMLVLMQRFWRDPERVPAEMHGVVLSAADGVVDYVWRIDENTKVIVRKAGRDYELDELVGTTLDNPAYVVGVGMSFLDVHVNRCPIAGRITLAKHIAGRFMSLGLEEAQFINERFTTLVESGSLNVATVQIASRLVRRIQSYLEVGQTVSAGQRLGMIRLGSLVAVVIPDREDVRIEVTPGDRVTAGISVLARFDQRQP